MRIPEPLRGLYIHIVIITAGLLLAACAAEPLAPLVPTGTPEPGPPRPIITETRFPPSATPTPAPTSTPTTNPFSSLCSPLEGIALNQFPQILQYDMETPRPGQDDGHHGNDYAFYNFNGRSGMEGLPVYTALNGVVASVTDNLKPYGNMVIIETPLDDLPPIWINALVLPTPAPILPPDSRMQNCPNPPALISADPARRSLYVLYGHFKEAPLVQTGQPVTCGTQIGLVGNTGMSGNPHLHLEVRVGPAGAKFGQMGYYDAGYTADEFANYCTWRISQEFQLVDPSKLVGLQQP